MRATNIANMNQRISFYKMTDGEDEMGQRVREPVLFKTVWAEVVATSSSENEDAEKYNPVTVYTVKVRYADWITNDMKITYKGKQLEIKSIINVYERNRITQMTCTETKEGGNDG